MTRRLLAVLSVWATAFVLIARAEPPFPVKVDPKKGSGASTEQADPKTVIDDAANHQERLKRQFDDFKQALLRLAQSLENSPRQEDKDKAANLKLAIQKASEQGVDTKFSTLVESLRRENTFKDLDQLQTVLQQNEELRRDLRAILELLLRDDRAGQLKREIAEKTRLLEELKKIIAAQERLIAKNQLQRVDSKNVKKGQEKVSEDTRRLVDPKAKNNPGAEAKKGENKDAKGKEGIGEAKDDTKDPKGETRSNPGKEGKDSKAGEGKDPKGAEGKDAKSGEGKDAKGAEGKDDKGNASKEGESKDGKGGEGKDGKSGEGKDAKGGEGKDGKGGEGKDGKGGEGKDGKSGEGKDGKSGEGKDSKPGESKANAGKPGPGQPSNPMSPKTGTPGKSGSGKPGAGKQGDRKAKGDGKGNSKGGSGGEGKPGEGKSGEGKSGQSGQKGESKSSQGQSGQSGQSGQPGQSGQQPPNDNPVKKQIQDANKYQRQAEDELDKEKRAQAGDDMEKARDKLEEARKKLEDLLKQLREEEIERLLAQLEARCRHMLALQIVVRDGTVELDKVIQSTTDKKPSRQDQQTSLGLADKEDEIVQEAKTALRLIEADGSAVAFAEVFQQVLTDMINVAGWLRKTDTGVVTVQTENDIIETLKEMIEALKKARKDNQAKQGKPSPPGQPPDPKLIDLIAELKMIRSMQMRVNSRTELYGKQYRGEQAPAPESAKEVEERVKLQKVHHELKDLSGRQEKLGKITHDIATGKNEAK
jgi:hypothetical protein